MSHRLFSSPLLPFVSNPLTSYWPVAPGPVSPALVVSTSRSILWDTIRMGHCISLSHCSFCNMIFLWRNWNHFPLPRELNSNFSSRIVRPHNLSLSSLPPTLILYIYTHLVFYLWDCFHFSHVSWTFLLPVFMLLFILKLLFHLSVFPFPCPLACVISTCSNHIDLSPLQWNTVTLLRNEVDVHVLTWNDIEGILPDDKHIVQQYI